MNLFIILAITIAFSASAEIGKECQNDFNIYCSNKPAPIRANRFDCLNNHFNTLKPECKKWILTELEDDPCNDDIQKFCLGEHQNKNKAFECLTYQVKNLTKDCKALVETKLHKYDKLKQKFAPCKEDINKYCAGKLMHEQNKCMLEKYKNNKLSPQCREIILNSIESKNAVQ